jgi:hypothetical protein
MIKRTAAVAKFTEVKKWYQSVGFPLKGLSSEICLAESGIIR